MCLVIFSSKQDFYGRDAKDAILHRQKNVCVVRFASRLDRDVCLFFFSDLYRCTCVCLCVSVCFGDTFGCFRLCIVRALGLYRLFYAILELRDAFYYLMTSSKATS